MVAGAIAGATLAIIEKQNLPIPTIPILGRAGTIAVGAYFLSKNFSSPLLKDLAIAAATLAAYQLLKEGKIEGDDGAAWSGV